MEHKRYTPHLLYQRRRKEHLREQWRNFKLVVDWTVWLYLLIPGLLYFVGWFTSLWTKPMPAWATGLSFPFLAGIIELVILTGGVLLFVEEADVLFLKSRRFWMRTLMKRGLLRVLWLQLGKMMLITALVAPLLVRVYEMSVYQIVLTSIWLGVAASFQVIAIHTIKVRYTGWRCWLLMGWLVIFMGWMTIRASTWMLGETWKIGLSITVVSLLLVALMQLRLFMKGTFEGDVREDLRTRLRLTALMLSQAVSKPKAQKTRTIVFRKSRPLLRKRSIPNRTAEIGFKAFFRNSATLKLYLQLGGLSLAAVALPPFPVNVIVCGLLVIMLTLMLYRSWDELATSEYVELVVNYDSDALHGAGLIMVRMLLFPLVMLMGYAMGVTWLGWLAGFLPAVCTLVFAYIVVSVTGWIRQTRA
ncbi:ABC transporter permease [Paenibacillus silvae]|jgi:ABC-2 type transport system permease protein|uniref:ABC transporter permease n=1 Tax=Paenibacillus silvae TaxID=1325358 RepID=UPI0025A30D83|nr:ABC transporter permease [Paenibacillus silvae]MDM5280027.1 ABC transporter permease [Paenibacillus silvae]